MSPLEYAKWWPNYAKTFGLLQGTLLFARVAALIGDARKPPVAIEIPGLDRPALLRPGYKDFTILQQVFVKREYDIGHAPQFRRVLQVYRDALARGETPLIIDCGAHVGLSVLWFRKTFPKARIFALEPNPENFAVLEAALGGLPEVTLFQGGIWDRPGTLALANTEAGMTAAHLSEEPREGQAQVPTITIDEILARCGAGSALVVKIDIEGGEAALFRGEADWLDRVELIAIELHDWLYPWQGTSHGFFRQISRRAFDYLFQGENLFCFRHAKESARSDPAAALPYQEEPFAEGGHQSGVAAKPRSGVAGRA